MMFFSKQAAVNALHGALGFPADWVVPLSRRASLARAGRLRQVAKLVVAMRGEVAPPGLLTESFLGDVVAAVTGPMTLVHFAKTRSWWARLLVRAAAEGVAEHARFIGLLSGTNAFSLAAFRALIAPSMPAAADLERTLRMIDDTRARLRGLLAERVIGEQWFPDSSLSVWCEALFDGRPLILLDVEQPVSRSTAGVSTIEHRPDWDRGAYHLGITELAEMDLLRLEHCEWRFDGSDARIVERGDGPHLLSIEYAFPTEFGLRFYAACMT